MLIIKNCPRCKGDMYIDRDRYGWHKQCIQCGHLVDIDNKVNNSNKVKEQELVKV